MTSVTDIVGNTGKKTHALLDIMEFVQITDTLMILFEENVRADR